MNVINKKGGDSADKTQDNKLVIRFKLVYTNTFNKYTILFLISPLFVLAWLFEAHLLAVIIFILPIIMVFIARKLRYYVIAPALVLIFYYSIVHVIVPFLINGYDWLNGNFGALFTILFILGIMVIVILGFILLPELKISNELTISPVSVLGYGLGAVFVVLVLLPILNLLTSVDFDTLTGTFNDNNIRSAIGLSMLMAFLATLIALVFGIPLGYILARKNFTGKSAIQGVVDVPVVIPHTVAGIALLTVFGAQGIIGAPLDDLGVKFVDAWPGIVIAMMFVSFPFVVNSARDGFQAIDPRMENVARSLGATRVNTFTKVLLPLSYKNIVTGGIMCWARAISEFGAVIILVYFPMIAPTLIYDRFTSFGLDASSPIAVLLVLICLVVFIILRFLTGLKPRALKSSNKRFV